MPSVAHSVMRLHYARGIMQELRTRSAVRAGVVQKARALRGVAGLVTLLFAAFAAPSIAQITVGGANPITITSSNNGVGVSASSTVSVTSSELPSAATVTAISVTFNGLNSSQLNAQAIALKAPNGTALDLVSGVCNSGNATFT